MMNIGICVGGPLAGQFASAHGPTLEAFIDPIRTDFQPVIGTVTSTAKVKVMLYIFSEWRVGGSPETFDMWVPADKNPAWAIKEIQRVYSKIVKPANSEDYVLEAFDEALERLREIAGDLYLPETNSVRNARGAFSEIKDARAKYWESKYG